MQHFLHTLAEASITTLGLFWMAFWAFSMGYLISSMIQVFVTQDRMRKHMGEANLKTMSLATFFGFISSSCSFAALSGARTLFAKGANFITAMAFLLSSTNLVIELGIVLSIFLSWQFVVAEYLGGLMLIALAWGIIAFTLPKKLESDARQNAKSTINETSSKESPNWQKLITSKEGWKKVANNYVMEWQMVWKDVTIGFTVAGIISAFVPRSFFEALFVGAGQANPTFAEVLMQALIAPVAAFFTFIGSMGNIPLAAVLYGNGVAFAGIIAFIFSDLVVFPVLRIQAKYYGLKMALYILVLFYVVSIITALTLHYGFAAFDLLPPVGIVQHIADQQFFKADYSMWLNFAFAAVAVFMVGWHVKGKIESHKHQEQHEQHKHNGGHGDHRHSQGATIGDYVLNTFTGAAIAWLAAGVLVSLAL